jgi:hypothetical protein
LADPKVSTYRTDILPSPTSTFRSSPYSSPDSSCARESRALPKPVYGDDACHETFPGVGERPRGSSRTREEGSTASPSSEGFGPGREVRRDGGEDIATVEGSGSRLQMVTIVGERDRLGDFARRLRRRDEQPVVGAYQQRPALGPERQLPPSRADPGIHHRQIHRIGGHVASGVLQDLRPGLHREARHRVRKVHDGEPGCDPKHHALARADEVVGETEIR